MPRPRGVPKEKLTIKLPPDLIDRVRDRLKDPLRNKTKHGSLGTLIEALLYEWDRKNDEPTTKL